jgi:hypothetical protein
MYAGSQYDSGEQTVLPPGTGTVTSVSVVTANGFAGTVADPTTTPAITLETTVTGILIGNGTGVTDVTIGTGLSLVGTTLSSTVVGAPVYASTLIPFGDGATPGGVTDNTLAYNLATQTFTVGAGNPVLVAAWSGGSGTVFQAGDITGNNNSTAIILNDGAGTLELNAPNGTIDFTANWVVNSVSYQWTGIPPTEPQSMLTSDGSGNLTWQYGINLNSTGGEYIIGDSNGIGNDTVFQVVDNDQSFIFGSASGGLILAIYSNTQLSPLQFNFLPPIFANDAAAGLAGLGSGQVYQTGLVGGISFLAIKQ